MGLRQNHFVAVVSHSITSSEMERAAPTIRLISRHFIAAPDTNAQDRRSKAFGKGLPMSALGQKRTCTVHYPMSALPLKATLNAFIRMSDVAIDHSSARSSTVGGTFRPSALLSYCRSCSFGCCRCRGNHTFDNSSASNTLRCVRGQDE
jgi:hypothetical protein